jgi:hypothetical protein
VAVGAFVIQLIQTVVLKQLTNFFHPLGIPILSDIDFVQYQFLLYGLALVAIMLLRPEGLFPSQRRRRELRTAEPDDATSAAVLLDEEGPSAEGPSIATDLR